MINTNVIVNVWLFMYSASWSIFNNLTGSSCVQIQCYTKSHSLIVLLLLAQSSTGTCSLVAYISYAQEVWLPSGRVPTLPKIFGLQSLLYCIMDWKRSKSRVQSMLHGNGLTNAHLYGWLSFATVDSTILL